MLGRTAHHFNRLYVRLHFTRSDEGNFGEPWDVLYDEQCREWGSFIPADEQVQTRFENALARVNALSGVMESRFDDNHNWVELCKEKLEKWFGEGVRLKPAN